MTAHIQQFSGASRTGRAGHLQLAAGSSAFRALFTVEMSNLTSEIS